MNETTFVKNSISTLYTSVLTCFKHFVWIHLFSEKMTTVSKKGRSSKSRHSWQLNLVSGRNKRQHCPKKLIRDLFYLIRTHTGIDDPDKGVSVVYKAALTMWGVLAAVWPARLLRPCLAVCGPPSCVLPSSHPRIHSWLPAHSTQALTAFSATCTIPQSKAFQQTFCHGSRSTWLSPSRRRLKSWMRSCVISWVWDSWMAVCARARPRSVHLHGLPCPAHTLPTHLVHAYTDSIQVQTH